MIIPFSPRALWDESFLFNFHLCSFAFPTSPLSLRKSNFHLNFTQFFRMNGIYHFQARAFMPAHCDCLHFLPSPRASHLVASSEWKSAFALSKIPMLDGGKFRYKICSRSHFTLSLRSATILFISGKRTASHHRLTLHTNWIPFFIE